MQRIGLYSQLYCNIYEDLDGLDELTGDFILL